MRMLRKTTTIFSGESFAHIYIVIYRLYNIITHKCRLQNKWKELAKQAPIIKGQMLHIWKALG